uniref:Uncharacterized protein n=1 Tax=Raphanus sativus TaxID=3726 RepID=A0A650GBY0_RAPSA|nr:hypothetical protein [Raphanus sativus]QGW48645.1 hypothetical protein [Raphanus sativus]
MDQGGLPEKNEHDRGVSSAAQDPRTYHEHHQRPLFVLFPAREGGSKKGSLLLSWTDGRLCSGRPSYRNASFVFV